MKSFLYSILLLSLLYAAFASRGETADQRLVAITFDYLPVAASVHKDGVTKWIQPCLLANRRPRNTS
ncbi:MAG: hypothetical protein DRR11_07355 [Gammaproteobacteria bacterium]|nr:MAG: hypothetical protein DRR11_07355 [Gammaproteobacteria bacterium]RLA36004.1 MAG: hypothetical protein DRR15_05935 [Gammaproteobacteria bacterium]